MIERIKGIVIGFGLGFLAAMALGHINGLNSGRAR